MKVRPSWMRFRKRLPILATGLVLVFSSLPAFAQLNYGRIYGAVADQSGGAIAGATVIVIDVARGISRPLTADSSGEYSASSLLPGAYTVRAQAMGFEGGEHNGITVAVGQDVRVDFSLQPGAQTETVTVTGDVPMVNTTSATLGGTLENATIVDLPLNGRAFQKLLDFNPGMQAVPGGGTPTYSPNGQRGGNITWMLDGVDEINMVGGAGPSVGGNGGGVDGITILSLDAIQEINLIESPKAEYGWMAGSVVNVGLKSGTNDVHGTAFAFGRDGAMDAKNAFLVGDLSKATDNLTQYGATIGGPIKKDKLFYFGAYEGNRYTLGTPRAIVEPTDAAGLGAADSVPDAIAGINYAISQKIPVALSPMSVAMAGCDPTKINSSMITAAAVAPFCGAGAAPPSLFGNNTNSQNLPVAFNNVGGSDNALAKIDYHMNDRNTLNGEFFYGNGKVNNATATSSPYWLANNVIPTKTGRVVWVWTPKSNIVNEMRFGVLLYSQLDYPADCNQGDGAPNYAAVYGYNLGVTVPPPQCGFASVTVTGFNPLGTQSSGGGAQNKQFSVWSGVDSVSYTRGTHLFKFGGEIHDTRFFGQEDIGGDDGIFAFGNVAAYSANTTLGVAAPTALQDFLTGVAATGSILVGNTVLTKPMIYNRYALFAQDDWRLTRKLTVNLGLRWEYVSPPTTSNNVLATFNQNSATGMIQETGGNPVYSLPKDLFSPRLGLAWDVTGKGTTVVRVGGSYMYDFLTLVNVVDQLQDIQTGFALYQPNGTLAPTPGSNLVGTLALTGSQISWQANQPVVTLTPNSVNSLGFACGNGIGTNPAPCKLSPIAPDFKPDAVTTWNLSVQHAFGNNLSLNVAYVGDHVNDLRGTLDVNQPTLGAKNGKSGAATANELLRRPFYADCPVAEGGQGLGGPCFPYFGQIMQEQGIDISNYNGLQTTLTERISHGLRFTAGYTYAHALDDSSGTNPQNTLNPLKDYGNATPDARHHFTLTGTYDIPGRKAPLQMLEGWQVNVLLNVLSALPYNAVDTTDDLSGTGILQDHWNILGSPNNIQGGTAAQIPCYGIASSSFGKSGACSVVGGTNTLTTTGAIPTPSSSAISSYPAQCVAAAEAASVSNGGLWNVSTSSSSTVISPVMAGSAFSTIDPDYNGLAALANLGCYFENGTAIVPAAQGTYGDMGRDVLRDHPFKETDLSITKSWKIRERLTAQFRGEFFNVFNATEYALPAANLAAPATFGIAASTPNTTSLIFGNGGPRTVQLGLKLLF
jgi:hypothetical protein